MKILHIVAGVLTGGAARGAHWLHQGLVDLGVDSKMSPNSKTTFGDERVISVLKSKKDKLFNFLRSQLDENMQIFYPKRKRLIFSTGIFCIDFTKYNEFKEADIIHLHWINGGFVNVKHLSKIDKPIVWTMRDMWPMTGGCHYAGTCEKFKSNCGKCPHLASNTNFDLSRYIIKRKKRNFETNIYPVAISNWIKECVEQSSLFKNNESNKLVSVIIPVYNRDKLIERTIDSVYNQVYRAIDLIIVNDASNDNSENIILKWKEKHESSKFKIIYIKQKNKGTPSARNNDLKNASGQYIQFLDSDDLLEKEKISEQVKELNKNEQYIKE